MSDIASLIGGMRRPDAPLQTSLTIFYIVRESGSSTDISEEVSTDLLSCDYTDEIDDEADTISISLKDDKGKWAREWNPTRGDSVQAFYLTAEGFLNTGRMMIDRLTLSGPPRTFNITGINWPLDNTIRRTIKDRFFEGQTLSAIGGGIASDNGLGFEFSAEDDPTYDRCDQKSESDLAFLKRLCDDAGLTIKVYDGKLSIFDQRMLEQQAPIDTVWRTDGRVLSYSIEAQQGERYKAVTVKWRDVKKKTKGGGGASQKSGGDYMSSQSTGVVLDTVQKGTAKASVSKGDTAVKDEYIDYTVTDDAVDDSGQIYVLSSRASSKAEAERKARAKLRELNLSQTTMRLSLIGNPGLQAGIVIAVKDFGAADGNYLVTKATHHMTTSGYTTELDLRITNTAY